MMHAAQRRELAWLRAGTWDLYIIGHRPLLRGRPGPALQHHGELQVLLLLLAAARSLTLPPSAPTAVLRLAGQTAAPAAHQLRGLEQRQRLELLHLRACAPVHPASRAALEHLWGLGPSDHTLGRKRRPAPSARIRCPWAASWRGAARPSCVAGRCWAPGCGACAEGHRLAATRPMEGSRTRPSAGLGLTISDTADARTGATSTRRWGLAALKAERAATREEADFRAKAICAAARGGAGERCERCVDNCCTRWRSIRGPAPLVMHPTRAYRTCRGAESSSWGAYWRCVGVR